MSQPFWGGGLKPAVPAGYDYDCVNTDVLVNRMTVDGEGRIVLPDGMSYRVLVLPVTDRMTPRVLRKVRELVLGGATVVGEKPVGSPSLEGYPGADDEVRGMANEVWGDLDGVMRNRRYFGKGVVIWGLPVEVALAGVPLEKDFEFGGPVGADVAWIHRRAGDTDIYFVANRGDGAVDLSARFRVTGREAEIWRADTGKAEAAGYSIDGGRTTVPLHLEGREAVFVVFGKPTTVASREVVRGKMATLATVSGAWKVAFAPESWCTGLREVHDAAAVECE